MIPDERWSRSLSGSGSQCFENDRENCAYSGSKSGIRFIWDSDSLIGKKGAMPHCFSFFLFPFFFSPLQTLPLNPFSIISILTQIFHYFPHLNHLYLPVLIYLQHLMHLSQTEEKTSPEHRKQTWPSSQPDPIPIPRRWKINPPWTTELGMEMLPSQALKCPTHQPIRELNSRVPSIQTFTETPRLTLNELNQR